MNTLLVPVDFSPNATHALTYAWALAQPFQARIILLYVHSPTFPDPNTLWIGAGPAPVMGQAVQEKLEALAAAQFQASQQKVKVEYVIKDGNPSAEILGFCEMLQPDLVVMGMSGKPGFRTQLLGSTASWVIQRATCPVLVIPETAVFTGIRKIAYATNFEDGDLLVLDRLLVFARAFGATIHCIHILDESDQDAVLKQEIITRAFRHDLIVDSLSFTAIEYDQVVAGLNTYAEEEEIDILVMLTHHRNIFSQLFHKSHTQQLALQTDVPLWVFQLDGKMQDVFSSEKPNLQ